jgi:hypothetical protein
LGIGELPKIAASQSLAFNQNRFAPTYRALTNKLGLGELPKMAGQSLASNQNWFTMNFRASTKTN